VPDLESIPNPLAMEAAPWVDGIVVVVKDHESDWKAVARGDDVGGRGRHGWRGNANWKHEGIRMTGKLRMMEILNRVVKLY
jgi:hypothetical protein